MEIIDMPNIKPLGPVDVALHRLRELRKEVDLIIQDLAVHATKDNRKPPKPQVIDPATGKVWRPHEFKKLQN